MNGKLIFCKNCNQYKKHKAKNLCEKCYRATPERQNYIKEYRKFYNKKPEYIEKQRIWKDTEESKNYRKEYAKTNGSKYREKYGSVYYAKYQVKSKFNLTIEQVLDILESQNNKCKICKIDLKFPDKNTHIDHDHLTKQVRSVLCRKCNSMLGFARDNIGILENAIDYIKSFLNA